MKQMKNSNNFVISIKCQQNDTWQGTIQWVEGHKEENFRSALEMIKLIDSAVQSNNDD